MSENLSKFEVSETIIVKRGSKAIEAGTEVKVLAVDANTGKYAVQSPMGDVHVLAAERLARKPERTFTESEVLAAIDATTTLDGFTEKLGLTYPPTGA